MCDTGNEACRLVLIRKRVHIKMDRDVLRLKWL